MCWSPSDTFGRWCLGIFLLTEAERLMNMVYICSRVFSCYLGPERAVRHVSLKVRARGLAWGGKQKRAKKSLITLTFTICLIYQKLWKQCQRGSLCCKHRLTQLSQNTHCLLNRFSVRKVQMSLRSSPDSINSLVCMYVCLCVCVYVCACLPASVFL